MFVWRLGEAEMLDERETFVIVNGWIIVNFTVSVYRISGIWSKKMSIFWIL